MSRRMLFLVATVSYSGWYFSREIWPGSSEAAHDTGHLLSFIQHSCWPPPPEKTSSTPPTTILFQAYNMSVQCKTPKYSLKFNFKDNCAFPTYVFQSAKTEGKGVTTSVANGNLWNGVLTVLLYLYDYGHGPKCQLFNLQEFQNQFFVGTVQKTDVWMVDRVTWGWVSWDWLIIVWPLSRPDTWHSLTMISSGHHKRHRNTSTSNQ